MLTEECFAHLKPTAFLAKTCVLRVVDMMGKRKKTYDDIDIGRIFFSGVFPVGIKNRHCFALCGVVPYVISYDQ